MSPDQLAGLGAFLSGAGAVLGAFWALRRMRARLEQECEERFKAFREGIKVGERHDRPGGKT